VREHASANPQPGIATAQPGRSRARGCLIEVASTLILTLVVYFVVTTFVAQPYEVQQESMRSTLEEGQYVLVDKMTPRFDSYSRGDIVVFNPVRRAESCSDPAVALPDPTPYIKRVIGEPGDLVELRDGDVFVNGVLIFEPYVRGVATGPLSTQDTWVVEQGRLFVMGDNRTDSVDSRSDRIGEICINDVVGRAFLRYWPLDKIGILQTPTYGEVPPPPGATPGPLSSPTPAPATSTPATATPTPVAPEATSSTSPQPVAVEHLRVEVIERRPHDATSYTEGLVMVDGRLYEGNGYGAATLREVDPRTGAILRSITIDSQYYGEGIAIVDDLLIQLTWTQHTALVYNLSDFHQVATFSYDTEGWGLCDDGTRLVMSDGTSQLYFRSRTTFELLGTVNVTNEGAPVDRLNELECVDGQVYANVWPTETIVRIDPSSGTVNGVIDASGLLTAEEATGGEDAVLNGIAYDATAGTFLLTGKLWPTLFEVRFVPL
jgi:signal peptidase I